MCGSQVGLTELPPDFPAASDRLRVAVLCLSREAAISAPHENT